MARQPIDYKIVVEDESIFTYDVKITSVWAVKGTKPRILTTGSKRKVVWFGALAEDGTQLFRSYDVANTDTFLNFVEILHKKYPKMIFFIDKATYHRKAELAKNFFRKNRDTIKVRWFPSGFPESNPSEETWRQGKKDALGSKFYPTFEEFKTATSTYYRTKRFKLDLYKYLCH